MYYLKNIVTGEITERVKSNTLAAAQEYFYAIHPEKQSRNWMLFKEVNK